MPVEIEPAGLELLTVVARAVRKLEGARVLVSLCDRLRDLGRLRRRERRSHDAAAVTTVEVVARIRNHGGSVVDLVDVEPSLACTGPTFPS